MRRRQRGSGVGDDSVGSLATEGRTAARAKGNARVAVEPRAALVRAEVSGSPREVHVGLHVELLLELSGDVESQL